VLSGNATPGRAAAFFVLTLISVASIAAFVTMAHSLAFFATRADTLAGSAVNALITFVCYPPVLFGGWSKVLLFAVVPAGFVTWLPAQLVRTWSWSEAGWLLLGSSLLWAVAALVWRTGLSRYESGNLTQAVEL
jgi:ABC-2 type transport system permease protein